MQGDPGLKAAPKPRLWRRYTKEVVTTLMKEFGLKNRLAVPRLEKIVVTMGVKEGVTDIKILDQCAQDLALITGQRAAVTRARKSIAGFKLRQGAPIGLKVTLRRARMYEFLDRLISVAMPRIHDFRGLSPKSFDPDGNYSFGIREQIIFPEVDYDKIAKIQGMNITLVVTGGNTERARRLLELLGIPFRK